MDWTYRFFTFSDTLLLEFSTPGMQPYPGIFYWQYHHLAVMILIRREVSGYDMPERKPGMVSE